MNNATVTVEQNNPFTFVKIVAVGSGRWNPEGVGFAKCSPEDKFDPEKGVEIARLRALKDMQARNKSSIPAIFVDLIDEKLGALVKPPVVEAPVEAPKAEVAPAEVEPDVEEDAPVPPVSPRPGHCKLCGDRFFKTGGEMYLENAEHPGFCNYCVVAYPKMVAKMEREAPKKSLWDTLLDAVYAWREGYNGDNNIPASARLNLRDAYAGFTLSDEKVPMDAIKLYEQIGNYARVIKVDGRADAVSNYRERDLLSRALGEYRR